MKYKFLLLFLALAGASQCTAQPANTEKYLVKPRDTPSKIAAAHNISLDSLVQLNKKIEKRLRAGKIYESDIIYVPVISGNTTPIPSPKQPNIGHQTLPKKTTEERLVKEMQFQRKRYQYIIFDPQNYEIELFNRMRGGRGIHDFYTIQNTKDKQGQKLLYAMNAGMFDNRREPIGLFISQEEEIVSLNTRTAGRGNFYELPPNGVFAIDIGNNPYLLTTNDYQRKQSSRRAPTLKIATQSGPMMVINNMINQHFTKGSQNLNIRNGVGVTRDNKVVLAISLEEVNFYEFSEFFINLGCENALYLDGFVSQSYFEGQKHPQQSNIPLGPIITLSEKKY